MKKIEISDENNKWLLTLMEDFGDTADDVLSRMRKRLESEPKQALSGKATKNVVETRKLDSANPPDLRHTRILDASIAGKPVEKREWNAVVQELHTLGLKTFGSVQKLKQFSLSRIAEGQKTDDGFKAVPGRDFSIQGMDANSCWRSIYHLAKRLDTPVSITFEWRNKEDAAFPGETATIESE